MVVTAKRVGDLILGKRTTLYDPQALELEMQLDADVQQELTFKEFASNVNPHFKWYRHSDVLAEHLEYVVSGEIKRLMVFMPPRHGKSEETSRLLPPYYLIKHPNHWVGLTSYGADLAHDMSRNAKANYVRFGGGINMLGQTKDLKFGVEQWMTSAGGGMWSAGVGGAQTGRGFHLGLIDDPVKDAEEAFSAVVREGRKNWYSSTFFTRQEPGAAIVLIMTRWHEEDLAGWLLEKAQEGLDQEGESWYIINFPAIKDNHYYQWPDNAVVYPDWRKEGEALCPQRYSVSALKSLMASAGEYFAESLYQQRPSSTIGKGRVYKCFDGDNVEPSILPYSKPVVINKELRSGDAEVWIGMDFNVSPMTAVLCRRVADQLHQFDEIELLNSSTEEMCQVIEHKLGLKPNFSLPKIYVVPDPSGKSRKTSAPAGMTDFSIIKSHGFELLAPKVAPVIVDRINSVNALCGEPGHAPRYFVHPRCRTTVKALTQLIYKLGTNMPEKTDLEHITSALGYLVHWLFPVKYSKAGQPIRRRI